MAAIFALGSNGSGQLGIGHREDVSVPKQVLFHNDDAPSSVRKLVAGGKHTLLLTEAGELLYSGDATTGACGRVVAAEEPRFRRVDLGDSSFTVGLMAATWEASVVTRLDERARNTRVYSFGLGSKGELGLGELVVRTPAPVEMEAFPPPGTQLVDLAACIGHVVAVLDNGDVYGWGNGRKGQLGLPETIVYVPRKIERVHFRVARAVCGREFTCLFGSAESGELLVLGSDKWKVRSKAPARVVAWADVGAGWGNVLVLLRNGALLGWGRDDHGQNAPADLAEIVRVAIGSEHALALTRDGHVMAWGWGEHGNCGPGNKAGDGKGNRNTIASSRYMAPGSRILDVGAGCASSWVMIDGLEGFTG